MSIPADLRRRAARGVLAFAALACLAGGPAFAATSSDALWSDVAETRIATTRLPRQIVPASYRTVALDQARLATALAAAPAEADVRVDDSTFTLTLPLPDGRFGEFQVVESPIMEPALAAKFPELRTYIGQGIDDPTATLRFDVTPTGFHGQIISWEGTSYVDPFQPGDTANYIAYRKGDARDDGERPTCHVTGEKLAADDAPDFAKRGVPAKIASGTTLRTYRLAMAATGEYTQFHGGTVANAMAAIITTVNRVNGIYERDLAVRMNLIANNDEVIYTNGGTDPYTNDDGFAMLDENRANLSAELGNGSFDVGHVVSTGGGGVAALGSVCSSSKAEGVTGSPSPVGDAFDVDYVAHEIGHQFGGNHTFNSSQSSCGGVNRNGSTAYEVGSGITIQAYAGICGSDNVLPNSVDYFHRVSLNEMLGFISTGGGTGCGVATPTGNTPPVVTAPAAFSIPKQTRFTLTAAGTDANNDSLTYIWEQFDLGNPNPAGGLNATAAGPLFRNFSPTASPSRTFPRQIPGGTWEVLPNPSSNRVMNFRVTARDNRAGGGGTNEAATALTVVAAAGPFVVTAPNTAVSWNAAQPQTVTWNVAGTSAAPIATATVSIHLSLDGGATYPLLLASGEPNDGSAEVLLLGSSPTTQARIRVSAENNVYFDTSDTNFTITGTPPTVALLAVQSVQLPEGNGRIDRNECNDVVVTLVNNGNAPATVVSATLSSSTPGLTATQPVAAFDDIPAGESRTALAPFEVTSDNTLACPSAADLALEVSYTGGNAPLQAPVSLPVGQAANPNYTFASSTGATIPGGGALVAGTQGDDVIANLVVPTGFNFSVYDTAFTGGSTLRVTSNGTLQLVASNGSRQWTNQALPASGSGEGAGSFPASAPVLMPYWDDIDTSTSAVTGGGVYTQLVGTSPNRTWIVEWRGEPVNQTGTAITANFAIEFREGSDEFAFVYAITGGANANGASATVGVQPATTGTLFTQHGFNTTSVSPGMRLTATRAAASCSADSGTCGVLPPGVTLTQSGGNSAVAENGATDSYTLVLNSAPSADVTLTLTPNAQVTAAPSSLVFTPATWNIPQTVTVTAVDDTVREGPHTGSIAHAASGGGYDAVAIPALSVAITDNDFNIRAAVSGLEGDGLVLQNGAATLAVTANGTSTFAATQATGSSYAVTVQTQPDAPEQDCDVTGGSGTVGNSDVTVQVACDTLTTQLAFGVQPSDVAAGTAIAPAVTVRLLDSLGNLADDDARSISIALDDNPGAGALTGTLAVPATAGVATFSSLRIDAEGEGYTLQASASGLPSATSEAFDVTAGEPAQLAFFVQPSTSFTGEAIAPAVTVRILDADGNTTASTATVTLTLGDNPGGGTLSGTVSVAAVNGVATFANLSIDAPGVGYTLDASSSGLTEDTSAAFDVIDAAVFEDGFEDLAP